ncbi:MAG: hypothetical protein NTV70_01520 [Acidobacteria bacterium]|nr:hypothetical protein [Acidobacteriota bacterium]
MIENQVTGRRLAPSRLTRVDGQTIARILGMSWEEVQVGAGILAPAAPPSIDISSQSRNNNS